MLSLQSTLSTQRTTTRTHTHRSKRSLPFSFSFVHFCSLLFSFYSLSVQTTSWIPPTHPILKWIDAIAWPNAQGVGTWIGGWGWRESERAIGIACRQEGQGDPYEWQGNKERVCQGKDGTMGPISAVSSSISSSSSDSFRPPSRPTDHIGHGHLLGRSVERREERGERESSTHSSS
jgi:hypothetical protein